jgi:hypothetical protein
MILKLVQSRGDLTLLPPAVLRLDLEAPKSRPAISTAPLSRPDGKRLVKPSWWTERASAGVAPGFTKEEIQADDPLDPSRPGGLFERLSEVLGQLSQSLVAS